MAKDKDDRGEALPGLTELLTGPREEPRPQPRARQTISDEELLAPLPQPGEAPRPQGVKVRAKAGTAPASKKGAPAKKKRPVRRFFSWLKPFMIPQDPVDRMRFKLRWLGLARYLFLPIIAVAVAILAITVLWYFFWGYNGYLMIYSRHVPTAVLLVPLGVGLALAVFIPVNWLLLNRYEGRWNRALRDMLRAKIPTKAPAEGKPADAKPEEAPKVPEPPLPQPTGPS